VVRAMEGSPLRRRRKRPTSSAARCWESAALPPLPHQSTLLPRTNASVIRVAGARKSLLSFKSADNGDVFAESVTEDAGQIQRRWHSPSPYEECEDLPRTCEKLVAQL